MPADTRPTSVTDAELVAYIDGELLPAARAVVEARLAEDAELRSRLETLSAANLPYREAFDLLLADAPSSRLATLLAGIEATAAAPVAPVAPRRRFGWREAAIAAAVVLLAGGACGYGAARWLTPPVVVAERQGWRDVVAEYLSLYTGETLAVIPDDADLRGRELAEVGGKLQLGLTPEQVALPDMELKRAQLFEFRGMPLGQIVYLSSKDGPVAFCIIANGRPDAAPQFEQRDDKNVVFWTKGGRGYLIIGKVPRETLEALASSLQSRVS